MVWEVRGVHLDTGVPIRLVLKADDQWAVGAVLRQRGIVAESVVCVARSTLDVHAAAAAARVRHEPVAGHAGRLRDSWTLLLLPLAPLCSLL